jgi:hypothetical protein
MIKKVLKEFLLALLAKGGEVIRFLSFARKTNNVPFFCASEVSII